MWGFLFWRTTLYKLGCRKDVSNCAVSVFPWKKRYTQLCLEKHLSMKLVHLVVSDHSIKEQCPVVKHTEFLSSPFSHKCWISMQVMSIDINNIQVKKALDLGSWGEGLYNFCVYLVIICVLIFFACQHHEVLHLYFLTSHKGLILFFLAPSLHENSLICV